MNKRFIIESNGIWDKVKGDEQLTWKELCDVLNEMDSEIKLLKGELCGVDKLFLKREEDLYDLELLQRFKYIDSKVHGRRCPSFIRDFLTMHDYYELDELELLLNSLYTQCRVNDLLKNEIIQLRLEKR